MEVFPESGERGASSLGFLLVLVARGGSLFLMDAIYPFYLGQVSNSSTKNLPYWGNREAVDGHSLTSQWKLYSGTIGPHAA